MENIELKIEYWQDIWQDLIKNFRNKSFGLNLYSPHILIDDIITEIEDNHLKNSDNKKYFYKKISLYLEKDEVIKSEFHSDFNLLRKSFNHNRNNYVLSLCYKIREKFKGGIYFKKNLELIETLILDTEDIDINFVNKLHYYSQNLITEFVKKSYVLEEIKKFLKYIFEDHKLIKDSLMTDFPHPIKSENFLDKDGQLKFKEYDNEIIKYLDSLTNKERINSLYLYFSRQPEIVKYIFYVKGIKGEIDKKIMGVHFYHISKRIFSSEKFAFEDLQEFEKSERKYVQVAVEVPYLMAKSSLNIAKNKVENVLDILSCYINFKTEVSVNYSSFLIVNKSGNPLYSTFSNSNSDSIITFNNAIDLNDIENTLEKVENLNFLWDTEVENDETLSKIKNALHWHHKAEQSKRDEDKILNYWIAIENLFNSNENLINDIFNDSNRSKFQLIQEIVSSHQIFKKIYNYGWELYYHFKSKVFQLHPNDRIPKELIESAQLNHIVGETVYLKNFIKKLPELKEFENNLFIQEKIDSVVDFYNDSKHTKHIIIQHIEQTKDDLLMIYRLRNLIVHNAHYDNTLLPYYLWKIKLFSGFLIRKFIDCHNSGKTSEDIIFDIFIAKEKLLLDLEKGKLDLFDNKNLC